jgi:hypothetical protein
VSPLFFKKAKYVFLGIFLAGFVFSLLSALQLSIYSDEVQWKLTVSRYFLDGGKLIYLFPACDKGWLLPIPITWYPGRMLDDFFYSNASSPEKLRYYGWSIFLGLIFLWTWIFHRISNISKFNCFLFISSFFSLGMLPYLMVLNRPEQSLLLWTSLALAINIFLEPHKKIPFIGRFFLLFLFSLFGFLMASSHPKGVYFFPLLIIVYRASEKSFIFLGGYLSALVFSAFETVTLWKLRTTCEESPWLTKLISQFSVQPDLAISNPLAFLQAGFENLKRSNDYFDPVAFHINYQSQWFPDTPIVKIYPALFWFLGYAIPYLVIASMILFLVYSRISFNFQYAYQFFQRYRNQVIYFGLPILGTILLVYTDRWQWAVVVLAYMITPMYSGKWFFYRSIPRTQFLSEIISIQFGILITILTICFMQTLKNFYEVYLLWPLFLLFFIYGTAQISLRTQKVLLHYLLSLMLCAGTGLSMVRIWVNWDLPSMQFHAPINRKEGQEKIKNFAKNTCGISNHSSSLILDDHTYAAYWDRPLPMHFVYLFGWWSTGSDPVETLKKRKPQGLVLTCLPNTSILGKASHYQDNICCLSKEELEGIQ